MIMSNPEQAIHMEFTKETPSVIALDERKNLSVDQKIDAAFANDILPPRDIATKLTEEKLTEKFQKQLRQIVRNIVQSVKEGKEYYTFLLGKDINYRCFSYYFKRKGYDVERRHTEQGRMMYIGWGESSSKLAISWTLSQLPAIDWTE